jgi:hypothetical protein
MFRGMALRTTSFFTVLLGVGFLLACGSSDKGSLYGGSSGGSSASGGSGAPAGGGTSSGGTSSGGAPAGGGTSSGGTSSGGTSSGGAPAGGGAPSGGSGGASSGGASSGGASRGGASSGGAPAGGGGTSSGGAPASLCAGHCGSGEPILNGGSNCYCDGICLEKGDCCPGFTQTCEQKAVACDADLCKLPQELCCQKWNGESFEGACATSGSGCTIAVSCNGPEDCGGGQVCCGTLNSGDKYFTSMACTSASSCDYMNHKRVICGGSGVCPGGYVCKSWMQYKYCGIP